MTMELHHEWRQLARELVEHGEDINRQDSYGETPLMTLAILFEEGEMLERAIGKGADITATNKWGATALLLACKKGCYDNAVVLVKRGADISVCDNVGKSILMHACENDHEKIAEFLIDQGCNVNVRDKEGFTALCYACCNRLIAIVKLLLDIGANVDLSTNNGRTPLMHSVGEKARGVIVELLLNSGVDVNIRDQCQTTALMIASKSRRAGIAEKLIRLCASLNAQDLWGRTALIIACHVRAVEVIVLLCKYGADVNLIDHNGDSAMTMIWLHERGVKALLQAGADADAVRKSRNRTLFWIACLHRNIKIMELLLKHNVNVNAQDNKGTTPLMMACKNDFPEIVTLLLQYGADVNVQSNNGTTAAIYASKKNNKECLEILLAAGANLDLIDCKGCTIFSYLLGRFNGKEIMTFLFEDGSLLTNGNLKDVHFSANNYVYYSHMAKVAIAAGAFDWGWIRYEGKFGCTTEALAISSLAMKAGFCPGMIGSLSPLLFSLSKGTIYADDFLKHRYYFPEDYRRLINDSYLKTTIENHPQLCEIINKPLSLLTWSFLTVSKSISLAGHPVSRCQRVDSLPIPHKLKELLKFRS